MGFNTQALTIYVLRVGHKREMSIGVPTNQKPMEVPVYSDIPKAILCRECCTAGIFLLL